MWLGRAIRDDQVLSVGIIGNLVLAKIEDRIINCTNISKTVGPIYAA